jgi:hypothetical protein
MKRGAFAIARPKAMKFNALVTDPALELGTRNRVESNSSQEFSMKKLFLTLFALAIAASVSGAALAQRGGGGGGHGGGGGGWSGGGGGSWSGGSGGGWHGGSGGSWSGGSGNWSGGGWHGGGSWNNGWHGGGSWNNGWHGGGWNNGWHGGWGWRGAGWGCAGWCGAGWWWPGVGISVGWPGFWGWPSTTFVASNPVTFVSTQDFASDAGVWVPQGVAPAQPATSGFWYYCTDPAGYFPYVNTCNRAWMQVVPNNNPNANVVPRLAQ